jgi:putative IMPACT (imprinted ancient) family translation regulator
MNNLGQALLAGGHSAAVDDGEPSGTAGRPVLEVVLRHQDLDGVLATVVRYFGGVNLGAGGLVRAYTDCIAQALLGAEKSPIVRLVTLRCAMPYALEGMARRELQAAGGTLGPVQHGAQVEMSFTLPEPAAAPLVTKLNEAGHGPMRWLEVIEAV